MNSVSLDGKKYGAPVFNILPGCPPEWPDQFLRSVLDQLKSNKNFGHLDHNDLEHCIHKAWKEYVINR